MSGATAAEDALWNRPSRSEAPWLRAVRAIRRKRLAMVCIVLIAILYGAGLYTLLDVFGVDTGLQDPNATNLQERRPIRATDSGDGETLGAFAERQGVELATLPALNPDLVEEHGALAADLTLPPGTQLILRGGEELQGPSWDHLLGTDRLGRDLFSRALFALRTTLIISVLAVLVGNIFLGWGLGLLAGYRGGLVDSLIMRAADFVLALPGLVILLVIVSAFGEPWGDVIRDLQDWLGTDLLIEQGVHSYSLMIFAMSFVGWGGTARFIRAQTLATREADFVLAAEASGASTPRILTWHLFPAVLPWIVVGLSASLGEIAGAEVVLTWLGIGVSPPTASFGLMVSDAGGWKTLLMHPQMLLVPMGFILVLMLSFNLLGDAINDVLNPRGR